MFPHISTSAQHKPGCHTLYCEQRSAASCSLFLAGWLAQERVEGGKLVVVREGRNRKFVARVQERTFVASSARGRSMLIVTERAVFRWGGREWVAGSLWLSASAQCCSSPEQGCATFPTGLLAK